MECRAKEDGKWRNLVHLHSCVYMIQMWKSGCTGQDILCRLSLVIVRFGSEFAVQVNYECNLSQFKYFYLTKFFPH